MSNVNSRMEVKRYKRERERWRGERGSSQVYIIIVMTSIAEWAGQCYRPSARVDNGTTFFLSDCVIDRGEIHVTSLENAMIGRLSSNHFS